MIPSLGDTDTRVSSLLLRLRSDPSCGLQRDYKHSHVMSTAVRTRCQLMEQVAKRSPAPTCKVPNKCAVYHSSTFFRHAQVIAHLKSRAPWSHAYTHTHIPAVKVSQQTAPPYLHACACMHTLAYVTKNINSAQYESMCICSYVCVCGEDASLPPRLSACLPPSIHLFLPLPLPIQPTSHSLHLSLNLSLGPSLPPSLPSLLSLPLYIHTV